MKKSITLILIAMVMAEVSHSQNVNWRSFREDQRNSVQINFGYDFGTTAQVGYGRSFSWIRPVVLGLDFSLPMGSDLTDDFKVRLGGQVELVEIGGFSATIKISSVFRQYQSAMVRIESFGSDFAALAGYYKPSWYAAGEFGFDKSITSYLKHSDIMKADFPGIRDGWYIPSGGHFYYGVQAGKTIGESIDLTLRVGATRAQGNDENALLPYYAQLGLGMKF